MVQYNGAGRMYGTGPRQPRVYPFTTPVIYSIARLGAAGSMGGGCGHRGHNSVLHGVQVDMNCDTTVLLT